MIGPIQCAVIKKTPFTCESRTLPALMPRSLPCLPCRWGCKGEREPGIKVGVFTAQLNDVFQCKWGHSKRKCSKSFKRYIITCDSPRFSRQNELLLTLNPASLSQLQSRFSPTVAIWLFVSYTLAMRLECIQRKIKSLVRDFSKCRLNLGKSM